MKDLGNLLKSQRRKRKLTYEKIYALAKIHPKYLAALEKNDYSVFDGALHARGFLKIYAELLGLNVDQILAIWRREFGDQIEDYPQPKKRPHNNGSIKNLKNGFTITPEKFFLGLLILIFLGFFGYIYHSYRNYQAPPTLEIHFPDDNSVVDGSLVDVSGVTDIDSTLLVNGESVLLRADGTFHTSVRLREGVNTLSIVSISSLNKKSEEILTLVYRPTDTSPEIIEEEADSEAEAAEAEEENAADVSEEDASENQVDQN